MNILIIVPALLSALITSMVSAERAFLLVYLPALLLLPNDYRLTGNGIPKVTFAEAAIIPIALTYFSRRPKWKITPVDVLIVSSFLWSLGTEFLIGDDGATRYLMLDFATDTLLPYFMMRSLVELCGMRIQVIRGITLVLAVVAFLNVWEFRMGINLFRSVFNGLFSVQASGWVTQIRWGYGRASGPFGHAILAGLIFGAVIPLFAWLIFVRTPEQVSKVFLRAQGGLLAMGLLMTLSRGPIMGAGLGLILFAAGKARDLKRALMVSVLVVSIAGGGLYAVISQYAAVSRDVAETSEQETAAYRAQLLDLYIPVVMEKPWQGWGTDFPQAPGAGSVDNHYLLLALIRGIPGVSLFALTIVFAFTRLIRGALRPSVSREERWWLLALAAAILSIAVSLTTVFLGEQSSTLFFMLLGWAEGSLENAPKLKPARADSAIPAPQLRFRRVYA